MTTLTLHDESGRDAAAIRRLLVEAFAGPLEADLVERLRDRDRLLVALVAERYGQVVGHIVFSPVTGETDSGDTVIGAGLAPVAVSPAHQRQGIGRALVEEGLRRCRDQGLPFAVVVGEPEYYARFGFESGPARGLSDEFGAGEAFQVLALRPGGLESLRGRIRYGAEFSEFS